MAYSFLGHTFAQSSGGGAVTTNGSGIDTSSADLIVVGVAHYNATAMTVTDNNSGTYTNITNTTDVVSCYLAYLQGAGIGKSGHTWTVGAAGTFPSIFVMWFSGSAATPLDGDVTGTTSSIGSTTGNYTASLTPFAAGQVFAAVAGSNGTGTPQFTSCVDGGASATFTITDAAGQIGGNAAGGGLAYYIHAGTGALNPTWTQSSSSLMPRRMSSFKVSAGGATTWGPLLGLQNNRLIITT